MRYSRLFHNSIVIRCVRIQYGSGYRSTDPGRHEPGGGHLSDFNRSIRECPVNQFLRLVQVR